MSFTPVGDMLQHKLGDNPGLKKQVEGEEVIDAANTVFEDFFGADLMVHIKPLFLKNRTLTVTISSSTVAQELRVNQKAIVDKINGKLGKNDIDRIRYLA